MKTIRQWVTGLVTLIAVTACGPIQAEDPLFFCGAVGEVGALRTEGAGVDYSFSSGSRPTIASFNAAVAAGPNLTPVTTPALELDGSASVVAAAALVAPTQHAVFSATLDYLGGEAGATGEMYIIIFSTTGYRDSFLYYLAQRDQSTTYADYLFNEALVNYSFWMGQENESLALYTYYTTLGDYYYITNVETSPNHAAYYYWYYRGIGAYFYYERQGNLAAAEAAFAYYLGLANASL